MRDHSPVLIENFNGLWKRGGADSCPADHFTNCNNIQFLESSVLTRNGIGPEAPYKNVARLWVFGQSLLILDTNGNLYHNDRPNRYVPILSLAGMGDFNAVRYANRAYITPLGAGQYIYVYTYGDTVGARIAGCTRPSSAPVEVSQGTGHCEQGIHLFKVAYETDTGFISELSDGVSVNCSDKDKSITLTIPTSPDSFVKKRHIVATQAIDPADFTGNLNGYQYFFIPSDDGGLLDDNTTASTTVSFYDAELLDDASYLDDLYEHPPNCNGLTLYHKRMVGWVPSIHSQQSLTDLIVSNVGDPESFNKIDGLISLQRNNRALTYAQEYRDNLYAFQMTKTYAIADNGDVPSTWPAIVVDNGIGAGPHGVGTIMDSGGINVEFMIIADYTGLILFDGKYNLPELTWKIQDLWRDLSSLLPGHHITFPFVQTVIDSQNHQIIVVFADGTILFGDYNNGLNAEKIKWTPWSFTIRATSVVIIEESGIRLVIGTKEAA